MKEVVGHNEIVHLKPLNIENWHNYPQNLKNPKGINNCFENSSITVEGIYCENCENSRHQKKKKKLVP